MRKLMISVLAGSLTVAGASAQVKAYKPSKPMEGNTVAYALPRSVVRVQVVAERESVRVGPYARFAQKLLGVMAPLADKDIYTIQSATLCAAQEADPAEVYALDNPDKSPLRRAVLKGSGDPESTESVFAVAGIFFFLHP